MYTDANVSFVAPAELPDGTPAVLKINVPDLETEFEADALEHWNGEGAVTLLAHDRARRALLVERCEPGTQLWEVADEEEANEIAVGVLQQLWRRAPSAPSYRRVADEAERWAVELPERWERLGRPFERSLLDRAVACLLELGADQDELVVCHQDFHGGNVLLAQRGWLAIDPKPLLGEREFDTASLLRDRRDELVVDPHPAARVRQRLDQLSSDLGLDRERMRGWGVAHALAWGLDDDGLHVAMVACARWFTSA
jgi:streptomycin 6-kinase